MASAFESFQRLGPAAFVLEAILAAIILDGLLLGFILLRRSYRRRFFARRDARVFEIRRQWAAIISGTLPFETWRNKPFDRRIVQAIALDIFEGAEPAESAQLRKFLRSSGLVDRLIFDAQQLHGWRQRRALVALGRTRAPEGIATLAEGLRDRPLETRLAALRGLSRTASPEAAQEILRWVGEVGLAVPPLPGASSSSYMGEEILPLSHRQKFIQPAKGKNQSVRTPILQVGSRQEVCTNHLQAVAARFVRTQHKSCCFKCPQCDRSKGQPSSCGLP